MKKTYYLLWIPDGWGVYGMSTCPDPGAFPNHFYRKYQVDERESSKLFEKLMKIKEKLEKKKIIPSEENYKEIFPELEKLLK